MRSSRVSLNEFELAILERLARNDPSIRGAVGQIHVLSRELTGVGGFTNFVDEESPTPGSERQVGLDALIRMPGVSNGMGAVLFCKAGRPQCLEVFTYGNEHWDGVYDGFAIEETA